MVQDIEETEAVEITEEAISAQNAEETEFEQKSISLNVGADETSRNITWYSNDAKAGKVQYAVKSGEAFPEQYETAETVVKII